MGVRRKAWHVHAKDPVLKVPKNADGRHGCHYDICLFQPVPDHRAWAKASFLVEQTPPTSHHLPEKEAGWAAAKANSRHGALQCCIVQSGKVF